MHCSSCRDALLDADTAVPRAPAAAGAALHLPCSARVAGSWIFFAFIRWMEIQGVDAITFKPDEMLLSDNGSIFQWYFPNLISLDAMKPIFPNIFYLTYILKIIYTA